MSIDMLIRDAKVVIPSIGIVERNIVIDDGKIKGLSVDEYDASVKIDASNLYAIPGLIDPHVHYGVFTPIDLAAESESRSAAVGGVTTMMRMLRLYAKYTDKLAAHLNASKGSHYVDYAYHASILMVEHLEDKELEYCIRNGITSFKLYMNLKGELGGIYMDIDPYTSRLEYAKVNTTEDMVERAISKVSMLNCLTLVHAEDADICYAGMLKCKEQGLDGLKAWSDARPSIAEYNAIMRIADLVSKYDASVYIVHVGSSLALDAIASAKAKGLKIYAETCPHYLTHTYEFDVRGKVVPPLRSKEDNARVWNALASGLIDCMGTDHVANRLEMKIADNSVWNALAGFPGLATTLPVLLSEGVNKGRITLEQLVRVTSLNTAKIFGLSTKGRLEQGYDADIVLIDIKKEQKVDHEGLLSYSNYSIYDGMLLKGWPVYTIVRGSIVMEHGNIVGKKGYGLYIARDPNPNQ
jgi:dihydropyrimidinase